MKRHGYIGWLMVMLPTIVLVASCQKMTGLRGSGNTQEQTDSLLNAAYKAKDYNRLMVLADGFETTGDITSMEANYWRGYAASRMNQVRRAELYWKAAVEGDVKQEHNLKYYAKSANRLANLLVLKNDFEGALRVALPALEKMEALGGDSIGDFANLLTAVGSCQLMLNMPNEAAVNYRRAFVDYQKIIAVNPSEAHFKSAMVCLITTTNNYLKASHYEEALQWAQFYGQLLDQYEQQTAVDDVYADKQRARVCFYRATALQGMGRAREAAESYRQALTTRYAKTDNGLIESTDYLMIAGRWREAAVNFSVLSQQMAHYNMEMSLDNIDKYLLAKLRSNVMAGRRDTAIAVALQVCDLLDSAVVKAKQSDAAELATIYDTQRKEAQIAQQQADLTQQRLFTTGVALVLVTVFFMVYTLLKRQAQHRLAAAHEKLEDAHGRLEDAHRRLEDAHEKLQTAYDQLETTTKAKARIDSELRIARNIQRQMLPSVFPDRKGIDLYAAMEPAKEVGGDLFDFLIQGDKLYFCLGDVSGKGVPAALFMAQAIRLFRALTKQHMMPADICHYLNEELLQGNDDGMFVTMFIGLADLTTGRLDFCNAGHNPPVVDGSFITMEANAPIGLWEGLEFVGEQIADIKGKPMFLYTDGLNEAENDQQLQFGEDRILKVLQTPGLYSAKDVIERMNYEVGRHRNGADPNDDLTMMCVMVD